MQSESKYQNIDFCQMCKLAAHISILCKRNHKMCESCVETQKLYTHNSCFLCEFPNWIHSCANKQH